MLPTPIIPDDFKNLNKPTHLIKDPIVSLEKEMAYLKGFLKGKGFNQALKALQFAKVCHKGQIRKTGEPYIMHPVRVCTMLLSLGVDNDDILAVALLHDVAEDCKVSMSDLTKMRFDTFIINGVDALTKKFGQTNEEYYSILMSSNEAYVLLPKLCDRSHNVSTMAGAFSPEKIKKYIIETETLVYELFEHAKKVIPEYSEQLFALRYQLESLLKVYKLVVESYVTVNLSDINISQPRTFGGNIELATTSFNTGMFN